MQLGRILSVRNSLLAVVGVLIAAMVSLAGYNALEAMSQRDAATRISESNLTADLLLVGGGNWAVERGVTNTALAAGQPVGQAVRAKIDARRTRADEALGKALERLESAPDLTGKDRLIGAVEQAHAKIVELRGVIDKQLELPSGERDAAQAGKWVPTMTALVMKSQELRVAVSSDLANDPVTSQLAMLKHFAWVMSEYAGRERAIVGATLSRGAQMSTERLQTLNGYRGRVETAWDTVRDIAGGDQIDAPVRTAASEAEANYFGSFQETRESVYEAGTRSARYPISAADWISAATKAIDSLLAIQTAATTATAGYNQGLADSATGSLIFNIALLLAAIVVGAGSVWMVTFRVVRPVNAMTGAMTDLAGGNLSVQVPAADRQDEIGKMAQAVQVFKDSGIERERLEAEAKRAADEREERERLDREREKQEAEQEREREVEARRVKEAQAEERAAEQEKAAAEADARAKRTAELCAAFDKTATVALETVSSASTEMQSTAQAMTATTEQTTERATAVAAASEQATSNVQAVSAAAEELSNSIAEIGRQVTQSSGITKRAVEEAGQTNGSIQGLAAAAQKIGAVVSMITDIAEQTNLLALNATIEAARAGDAGKGFAVVASEVKSLANQTAKATEEIAGQVSGMQGVTDGVVKAIEGISTTIGEANGIATSIAAAIEQQGAATQEIARNVQQAANGTQEVSSNIVGVSQAASEAGGAAGEVLQAAGELSRQSESLRGEVDKFLAEVRAV